MTATQPTLESLEGRVVEARRQTDGAGAWCPEFAANCWHHVSQPPFPLMGRTVDRVFTVPGPRLAYAQDGKDACPTEASQTRKRTSPIGFDLDLMS